MSRVEAQTPPGRTWRARVNKSSRFKISSDQFHLLELKMADDGIIRIPDELVKEKKTVDQVMRS